MKSLAVIIGFGLVLSHGIALAGDKAKPGCPSLDGEWAGDFDGSFEGQWQATFNGQQNQDTHVDGQNHNRTKTPMLMASGCRGGIN